MFSLAYGQIGLSPSDFWDMSWVEFNGAVKGLSESRKHDYNVMRNHASLVMSVHVSKKDQRKLSPQRIFPLRGDVRYDKPSKDQVLEMLARSNKRRGIN